MIVFVLFHYIVLLLLPLRNLLISNEAEREWIWMGGKMGRYLEEQREDREAKP